MLKFADVGRRVVMLSIIGPDICGWKQSWPTLGAVKLRCSEPWRLLCFVQWRLVNGA